MALILGLAVAVAYGSADFLGGLSARRASLASVVVGSQLAGLAFIAAVVPLAGGSLDRRGIIFSVLAGAVGGFGLTALYRGLALGRMNVVAPITAVGAAVLPVGWGIVTGERPPPLAMVGVVVALVAVILVSRIPGDEVEASGGTGGLVLAVVAGIAFGVVFVLLAEVKDGSGFLPLLTMRTTSVVLLGVGAVVTRRMHRPPARAVPLVVLTGLLDITANALYLLAVRQGFVSLVAVLGSLYPAATVVLARVVLDERLSRAQTAGLTLAAGGIALIATG